MMDKMILTKQKQQTQLAKCLRHNETDSERNLWARLRNTSIGVKFRRQQPIGDYIVDFVSFNKKLVIEVDGSQHSDIDNIEYDRKRTQYLERRGFRVIRFWDNDILNNIEGVISSILSALNKV
jgi:very-short-patch-repair endonuclease